MLVGVCVPTAREESIASFLDAWRPWFDRDDVLLFVHEDRASKSFEPDVPRIRHTAQEDIAREIGKAEWIIPRGSGACRSFPMYLAWKEGCDFIITLDDDCHPESSGGDRFIDGHLESFRRDRWFRTIAGDEPRGVPYERLGLLPVALNHGLWSDVPDLDGPTSLVRLREPRTFLLPRAHEVVPPGMAFPLCAMNVCYRRVVIPAAYNLLMGLESNGLDRFDDIWSGLILKRVIDYMGWYVTTGEPFVRHRRQSDPFLNLRREALGIQIHERLWDYILDTSLESGLGVTGAFRRIAERLRQFPDSSSGVLCPPGYFQRVAAAMQVWSELFECSGEQRSDARQ
jgi:hypothetical protein